jgi:hypothetical protein
MRETIFRPASHPLRTSRLASLAATGTFLDHLPCTPRARRADSARRHVADIGITFQLLTLRAVDGERALEPRLSSPVSPGTDPAERFLLSGSRLLEATRETIISSGKDGRARAEALFANAAASCARDEITELVSLQRRWGAASNGLAVGDRTACRIRAGVVLLGALLMRSASLDSLATLFAALDSATARGLPSIAHSPGECQLDILAIAGGALDELPALTSIIHGQGTGCPAGAATVQEDDAWTRAPYRLEGRNARRAASQLARFSPLSRHAEIPA